MQGKKVFPPFRGGEFDGVQTQVGQLLVNRLEGGLGVG